MKTATPAETAFWDASGVVLLCVHQPSTAVAKRIRAQSPRMALWWGTFIEVESALHRLHREKLLSASELSIARTRLSAMREASIEVVPTETARSLAVSLLEKHDLRAGDALQLAAALVLCRELPRGRRFVCFDAKLAQAADRVGFTVQPSL